MPESVTDRPTKSHEYLFILAKSEGYYYNADAIAEPIQPDTSARNLRGRSDTHKWSDGGPGDHTIAKVSPSVGRVPGMRNRRSVWTIPTAPFPGAHFATFPRELIEPCILAGSRPGDVVFDPFHGSGTTGQVATDLGRQFIGCELNSSYAALEYQYRRTTFGMPI